MLDRKNISLWLMTAATFVAAVFLPLLVKLFVVPIPEVFQFLGYPFPLIDGFSFAKGHLLIFAAALSAIGLVLNRTFFKWTDSLLLAIAILIALSCALSPYRSLTTLGVPFIFEGWPMSLAYLLLAMSASRLSNPQIKRLFPYGLAFGSCIISIFGLGELVGKQFINSPFIANWALTLEDGVHPYTAAFLASSVPFGNPNYVGLYAAMLFPFLFIYGLTRGKIWETLLFLVASLSSFALLLSSMSRGGLVACGIVIPLSILLCLHKTNRNRILVFSLYVVTHAGCYLSMDHYSSQRTSERVATVAPQFTPAPAASLASPSINKAKTIEISKMAIEAGRLRMEGQSEAGPWTLILERQYRSIKFMDESFRPLLFRFGSEEATDADKDKVEILDPRYKDLRMSFHDNGKFRILSIQSFDIAITNWGFRLARSGAFVTPVAAERFPLPIADETFSYRGFIWSYSLPLLKKTLFLGMGPGSFPFEFPNNDPIKMSAVFGLDNLVDKPHNLFISFAHSYGVIALILVLILITRVIWRFGAKYRQDSNTQTSTFLPYLAGLFGYLICGLTADSTIGVSAIFWIMLGILCSNQNPTATRSLTE